MGRFSAHAFCAWSGDFPWKILFPMLCVSLRAASTLRGLSAVSDLDSM